MARKPRQSYGKLSKRSQERLNREARRLRITEESAHQRYNRGTWNPFARKDLTMRIPVEYRREPIITPSGEVTVDWYALANAKMESVYGDYIKWNEHAVAEYLSHASEDLLHAIVQATPEELDMLAHVQKPDEGGTLPFGLTAADIGYFEQGKDRTGRLEWINIFWYH
jgi:hypothetical protein